MTGQPSRALSLARLAIELKEKLGLGQLECPLPFKGPEQFCLKAVSRSRDMHFYYERDNWRDPPAKIHPALFYETISIYRYFAKRLSPPNWQSIHIFFEEGNVMQYDFGSHNIGRCWRMVSPFLSDSRHSIVSGFLRRLAIKTKDIRDNTHTMPRNVHLSCRFTPRMTVPRRKALLKLSLTLAGKSVRPK